MVIYLVMIGFSVLKTSYPATKYLFRRRFADSIKEQALYFLGKGSRRRQNWISKWFIDSNLR